jgi:hypothetical protein
VLLSRPLLVALFAGLIGAAVQDEDQLRHSLVSSVSVG